MKRLFVGKVLIAALIAGLIHTAPAGANVCLEDMACWDCTTMGNQICGEVK